MRATPPTPREAPAAAGAAEPAAGAAGGAEAAAGALVERFDIEPFSDFSAK